MHQSLEGLKGKSKGSNLFPLLVSHKAKGVTGGCLLAPQHRIGIDSPNVNDFTNMVIEEMLARMKAN